jgi:hypothetical protein
VPAGKFEKTKTGLLVSEDVKIAEAFEKLGEVPILNTQGPLVE